MILLALMKIHIISTDEDPGLRIESIAVINLRGVSTNKTIINMFYRHANIQRTYHSYIIEKFHRLVLGTSSYYAVCYFLKLYNLRI